jgi:hypothetical protein
MARRFERITAIDFDGCCAQLASANCQMSLLGDVALNPQLCLHPIRLAIGFRCQIEHQLFQH